MNKFGITFRVEVNDKNIEIVKHLLNNCQAQDDYIDKSNLKIGQFADVMYTVVAPEDTIEYGLQVAMLFNSSNVINPILTATKG